MWARTLMVDVAQAKGGLLAMVQTMLAQGLTMAINLATGILTARLLGPEGRGEYAAAAIWLLLPSLLAVAGLQNAVVYLMRQRPAESQSIGLAGLLLSTAAFVPLLLLCLWLLPWLMQSYSPGVVALARAALLLSVLNVWMVMARQWLLGLGRFAAFNTVFYSCALTYLVLLLVLVALHAVTPANAVLAQIGSTALALLAVLPLLAVGWRHRGLRPGACVAPLLRYGLKAAPIDLMATLGQNIDRLVLVAFVPAAVFGIYVVAMSFARLLSVLQNAVAAVMLADLANGDPVKIEQAVHRCFRMLLWALVVLCGLLFLVDARLLALVYGPGFASAAPIFRVLLLDAALTCLTQVLIQGFLSIGMPGLPSTIQVASFCVTTVAILVLTPTMATMGAALALAGGSMVRLALLLGALPRAGLRRPGLMPRLDDVAPMMARFGAVRLVGGSAGPID